MPLATTKIWPVRDSLRRVVDYAANPDKTEYSGLAQALHYAENGEKTTLRETAQLVSGIHCRPETAWAEMRAVQEQFGKTEGVVAMHAYQSFKPGEVTPEQCHAIGVALARRVWGGRFQVLVATHLNTDCPHNHFVINAVSYVDGKKYEQRREQYREMRRVSDQLCREHALSVIQQPGSKKPRPLYEGEGQTRYEAMRRAIRKAISQASTERDFARVLRQQGYLWRREEGRKYATLRSLDGGRAVRVYRLGAEYDWPTLERALAQNFARYGPHFYALNFDSKYSLRPVPRSRAVHRRCRCKGPLTGQKSSLFRLYLYYCYQLGIYPKRPAPRVNWPEINALWRDIGKTLEELHLTSQRGFSTVAEVKAHREALAEKIAALCKERADCARQLRWRESPPGAAQRRAELTRQIASLHREDVAARRIIEKVEKTAACRDEYRRQQERDKPRQKRRDKDRIR